MNEWNYGNLAGLIPILGGIYALLLVNGALPRNPRNPEKMELWRRQYRPTLNVLVP